MNKATKFTVYLGLYIIGLSAAGMLMTFVNDIIQASGFFGDTLRAVPEKSNGGPLVDPWYDWGARHYWYYWMCILLFILSVARVIIWVDEYIKKHKL